MVIFFNSFVVQANFQRIHSHMDSSDCQTVRLSVCQTVPIPTIPNGIVNLDSKSKDSRRTSGPQNVFLKTLFAYRITYIIIFSKVFIYIYEKLEL